jgi:hypothetical protein
MAEWRVMRAQAEPENPYRHCVPWALAVALLHLSAAWWSVSVAGLSILADEARNRWDYFWQLLPLDLLRSQPLLSIWNLHSQPPLYNILGAALVKCCGADPLHCLHALNITMGVLLSGMLYVVALELTCSRAWAVALAIVLAFHPALVLYEAYLLYDLTSVFLFTTIVFAVARHARTGRSHWLLTGILALNLLMLTRSLFHLALLVLAIPCVGLLAHERRWRVMALALVLSLPTIGWYVRSSVKFGFFGASSWSGLNLWRIAASGYTQKRLQAFARAGLIDAMAADDSDFRWPRDYRRYGYTQTSDVEALRRDDFNNINLVAVAQVHGKNALRLIAHDPTHYARNVGLAYVRFCHPSTELRHMDANRSRIASWENVAGILQGRPRMQGERSDLGSFLFFLLPSGLLLVVAFMLGEGRRRHDGVVGWFRAHSVLGIATGLIVYTAVVGCLFELGENERFKLIAEQVTWVWLAGVLLHAGRLSLPLVGLQRASARAGRGSG